MDDKTLLEVIRSKSPTYGFFESWVPSIGDRYGALSYVTSREARLAARHFWVRYGGNLSIVTALPFPEEGPFRIIAIEPFTPSEEEKLERIDRLLRKRK